jgi:hypothetical protein
VDLLIALKAVREVSILADPERPEEVAQSAWDAAREQSANFPKLPRAKHLAEQLGMPWPKALQVAHKPERSHGQWLAQRGDTIDRQDWLTEDYIAHCLKSVAHRLGLDFLSWHRYEAGRAQMLKEDRASWLHGGQLLLPTAKQICLALAQKRDRKVRVSSVKDKKRSAAQSERADRAKGARKGGPRMADTWREALEIAELKIRSKPGGSTKTSVDAIELFERCYAIYGVQPTAEEAIRFAWANRIPFNARTHAKGAVERWKRYRRKQGLEVPDRPPPRDERPDYTKDVGAGRPSDPRAKRSWSNIEDCLDYVVRYLEELPSGAIAARGSYRSWALQQKEAPSDPVFVKHGGWSKVLGLAQAKLLEAQAEER